MDATHLNKPADIRSTQRVSKMCASINAKARPLFIKTNVPPYCGPSVLTPWLSKRGLYSWEDVTRDKPPEVPAGSHSFFSTIPAEASVSNSDCATMSTSLAPIRFRNTSIESRVLGNQ